MSIKSQKIVVAESATTPGVATVTTADAGVGDIITTAVSSTEAVTGGYGLIQRLGLFVGGMVVESKWKRGSWNPL